MKIKNNRLFKLEGIRGKVLNLIVYAIILLTAAYLGLSTIRSNILSDLVAESNQKQRESIYETTSSVMDEVVEQNLGRSNLIEARIADEMFDSVRDRVNYLADYATLLFNEADQYSLQPYSGPDLNDDGKWSAKIIYADGTDRSDQTIRKKLGLLSNMTDMMISLCQSFDATTVYIALPEGVHMSISSDSAGWFENGEVKSYDPRNRGWYQKAVDAGDLIFSDGERDAVTGVYCIECAKPVYGSDGSLLAVVGTDLFLDEMEENMKEASIEGEYYLLVNHLGRAVLAPQEETFPMAEEDKGNDLRNSKIELLADTVSKALNGKATGVVLGELSDGEYYITANPIKTTGWVLVSAYKQAVSGEQIELLQSSLDQIQKETVSEYRVKQNQTRIVAIGFLLFLMALILFGALVLGTRIVKPLNTISTKISEISEEKPLFKMEEEYRTGDEVEKLAESFAAISQRTVNYMEKVVKVTAEKERISAELSLAKDIQLNMLPHIFPAFPDRNEFDVYASMDPAKEVGGDFYDYFLIDDDHLGLVMADVSGKGIPAALFMMATKIILQSVAMLGGSPAEILNKTNQAICSSNEAEMFVTVWIGILEISTGKLIAANAGHEYPVIRKPDGKFEIFKDKHGFVIGGFEESRYSEYEMTIKPGSEIFLYTDGVPEAADSEKQLFGVDRMVEALNRDPQADPEQILKNVRAAVDDFVKDAEQFDDLTMMCLKYNGYSSDKN